MSSQQCRGNTVFPDPAGRTAGLEKNLFDLLPAIENVWRLSEEKILALEEGWDPADGSPVFTVEGAAHRDVLIHPDVHGEMLRFIRSV